MDIPQQPPQPFSPQPQSTLPGNSMPVMHPHSSARLKNIVTFFTGFAVIVWTLGFYFHCFSSAPHSASLTPLQNSDPQTAYEAGNYALAITHADAILKSQSAVELRAPAAMYKSLALSQEGIMFWQPTKYGPEAVDAANQAISLSATSAGAYRALGFANEIQGNYADAHTAYQKALAIDAKNIDALVGDARVYELEGNVTKAKVGYQSALAVSKFAHEANLGLGRLALAAGDKKGALSYFMSVYNGAYTPTNKAQAAYAIGIAFMSLHSDNLSLAEGMFKEAASIQGNYTAAWLALGTILYMESSAKGVSSTQKAADLTNSASAMLMAVTSANLDPSQTALPVWVAQDLAKFGNASAMSAALSAASTAVLKNGGLKQADAAVLQPRFAELSALISGNTSK